MNTCRLNCFIWDIEWINKDEKCCLLYWIVMVKQISKFIEHKTLLKILKKSAHAYFGRLYFSKSFGGKIHQIWTDVTYRMNKKNFLKSPLNSFFFQVHGTLKLQVLDFGKRILTLIRGSLKEMCYSPICTSTGILFQMAF